MTNTSVQVWRMGHRGRPESVLLMSTDWESDAHNFAKQQPGRLILVTPLEYREFVDGCPLPVEPR